MNARAARRRAMNPARTARPARQAERSALIRSVVRRERQTGRHLNVDIQAAFNRQLFRRKSQAARRVRRGGAE